MTFKIDNIIIKETNRHFEVSYKLMEADGAVFSVRRRLPHRIYPTNRVTSLLKQTLMEEETIDRGAAHSDTIRIKARRCRLLEKKQAHLTAIPLPPTSSSEGIQSLTQEVRQAKKELQHRIDSIALLEQEIAQLKAKLDHLMNETLERPWIEY